MIIVKRNKNWLEKKNPLKCVGVLGKDLILAKARGGKGQNCWRIENRQKSTHQRMGGKRVPLGKWREPLWIRGHGGGWSNPRDLSPKAFFGPRAYVVRGKGLEDPLEDSGKF